MDIVAKRLRAAREAVQPPLSQRALAELIGGTFTKVSHWENGRHRPNYEILKKLAELYNVKVEWLLGEDAATKTGHTAKKPAIHTVPVVERTAVARWNLDAPIDQLQTAMPYQSHTAAACIVAGSALASVCPPGSYIVISKGHKAEPGQLVLALIDQMKEPVLRRLIHDGGEELLVADDGRFATYHMSDARRIIGTITEVIIRKKLV